MPSLDIGIDLGTSTILASDSRRETVVREPSVVAVKRRTGEIMGIGEAVYKMIGRAPDTIEIIRPLVDGVISDYRMAEELIKHLLRRINYNQLLKPRVCVCVPSGITRVGSNSVLQAAVAAGARKVFLIEEPVAAAIGSNIDISKPEGRMIVDVGGGTTDIAVLSFNGIVCKRSIKVAGIKMDEAIIKYIRSRYNLLIGEKTAEQIKIELGSVRPDNVNLDGYAKGRDLISGLPKSIPIRRSEFVEPLRESADLIVRAVQSVLEKTPPELVGDIRSSGILLTGGGSLIHGLDTLLTIGTHVEATIAENPIESVAVGTARSFTYLNTLNDGFVHLSPRIR